MHRFSGEMAAFILAVLGFSFHASAAIFGQDDRVAIVPGSAYAERARSTAIAVLDVNLQWNDRSGFSLGADSMSSFMCSGERFRQDPSTGYSCSAFLVAPDLMVSAGHCFVNTGEVRHEAKGFCAVYSFLFDYEQDSSGLTQTQGINPDRVFRCKEVVYAINGNGNQENDFAIIKLDHPVWDRAPLQLSTEPLEVGDSLTMIGYPVGSPAKFTGPAKIIRNDAHETSLLTRLNALDGNSGSSVFNRLGQVVGILVSGRPGNPFVEDKQNKCSRINHCDMNGRNCLEPDVADATAPINGSDVQRIEPVVKMLKQLSAVASLVPSR